MRDEKLHAVVARSTFPSQNIQSTPLSDHFWKLRCRISARRCGAKHISKSKKGTPLWREAHVEVKMEVETVRIKRHVVFTQRKKIHREDFTHRSLYTERDVHRAAFTQMLLHTDAFTYRSFYTERPFRKEALAHEAFTQSSFTHRRFFTKKFLHTGALTRRCPSFYTQDLLHTHTHLTKEAFRHRNFYSLFTRKLLHRSFCTEMPLQTEAFIHTQKLLLREAFKQSSFFTHTEAITQRRFCTGKLFHRQAFAGRNFEHKRFLMVFTYSSFHTEKPLRGPAFTFRFDFTEQRLCGAAFTHWSFDAERPLHKEAFTHRGFHPEALHREAFTQRSV